MKWNPNHRCVLCLLFALSAAPVPGAIIPSGALPGGVIWASNQVGVIGGIPNYTNIFASFTPSATSAQICQALQQAPPYSVVLLADGVYILTPPLVLGGSHSGVVLRGSSWNTILEFTNYGYGEINIEGTGRYGDPPQDTNRTVFLAGGYTQGSTNLILASKPANEGKGNIEYLQVGTLICLTQANDTNLVNPVGNSSTETTQIPTNMITGALENQEQYVMVTGIDATGTNISIWPPVYMTNYQASLYPNIWWAGVPATNCGVENLTIYTTASATGSHDILLGGNCYNCWVKNVNFTNSWYDAVETFESAHCSVVDCYIHNCASGGASTTYGVNFGPCSDCLAEDNVFFKITNPGLIDCGASGCVFAYNFCTNMIYAVAPGWMSASIQTHGAHPMMNLFEGNIGSGICFDDIHGSSSHNTAFRNYFYGYEANINNYTNYYPNNTYPVDVDATNRCMSLVGNILGTPGYHTNYQYDVIHYNTNYLNTHTIYRLGFFGNYFTNGDPASVATFLRNGNWDAVTGGTVWDSNGVQALPASYYLTTEPTWWTNWGEVSWPPIGPDVTPMTNAIPAELRFQLITALISPPTNLRIISP